MKLNPVSNNYLDSIKCSVENNFHFLVNVCFPIALLFRLLSVWNFIQLRISIFTLHVIFPLVPIMKSCTLCDNCVLHSTSQVSNNYLGSNKCSVENNFHFLDNVWFPIALLFGPLSVRNFIQLRMSILSVNVIFPLVPTMKSCTLCDNCLVYSTSLDSNNYLGSNKCSVDNNLHFSDECLVSSCFSDWTTVCMKHYPVVNVYLFCQCHFPPCSYYKSGTLCDNCLVYSTSLDSNNYLGSNKCSVENNSHLPVNVLFPIALLFRLLSVCDNVYPFCECHFPPCS